MANTLRDIKKRNLKFITGISKELEKNVIIALKGSIDKGLRAGKERGIKGSPAAGKGKTKAATGEMKSSWHIDKTRKRGKHFAKGIVTNPTKAAGYQGHHKSVGTGGTNLRRRVRDQIRRTIKNDIKPKVKKALKKTAKKRYK